MTHRASILVVDDNREFLKLLTGVLSAEGYAVRAADGGELALAAVEARKPDLILLDIRMPRVDGFEVCRRLKEREDSRGIPVVLFSGTTEVEERVHGLRLGAVDFVAKPFRSEELLARVRIHLELSRLQATLERRVEERTAALGVVNEQLRVELERRTQAEDALRRERDLVSRIMETSPVGIVASDGTGTIVFANEAAEAILGLERHQATGLVFGSGPMRLTDYEGAPLPVEALPFERVRAQRRAAYGLRHAIDRADGHRALLSINAAPLFSGDDEIDGMVAAIEDVTFRKRAEAERERLFEEAQTANRAKDRFLAVLSHELRNPLAAIQASVNLLERSSCACDPRLKRAMEIIERNTKLQSKLVDDLLSLSRIVQGKLSLQRAPVELETLVCSAIEAVRASAEYARISLEARIAQGLWTHGDIDRLQQVIINLLSNAIKFTLAGGKVVVSLTAQDGKARIVVEDTGIGIEANRLESLFQAFQQGQVGGQRARGGMGIGLALVKSLTDLHAGRVWAESAGPGRGSRFTLELPLMRAPAFRGGEERPVARDRRIRALVVEDNPDTRVMLEETLSMLAYEVASAASGEEALGILGRERFDVILADIGLPGMDGYEFLTQARRLRSAAGLPAFAVTGYGQERDARRAREAGFIGHFVKPVDIVVLDRHIREVIQARGLALGAQDAQGAP